MPLDFPRNMVPATDIVDEMRALLGTEKQWVQQALHVRDAYCLWGAYRAAVKGEKLDGSHPMMDASTPVISAMIEEAKARGSRAMFGGDLRGAILSYNDEAGRTYAEILDYLEAVRRRVEGMVADTGNLPATEATDVDFVISPLAAPFQFFAIKEKAHA